VAFGGQEQPRQGVPEAVALAPLREQVVELRGAFLQR
jgi:hypothetical protein